jgi:RecB family exonuclease
MSDDIPAFNPGAWDTSTKGSNADLVMTDKAFNPQAALEAAKRERQKRLDPLDAPLGTIPATSFSSLSTFEKCAYHLYLSKVEKHPDPSGPAAERGTKIHDMAEAYMRAEIDEEIPAELSKFTELFQELRARFAEGHVHVEEDWAFTRVWDNTGWTSKDCWLRVKLDAMDRISPTAAIVYDWKTGRKFGNEIKHGQQALLYVLAAFIRYPELEFIESNMVYLDKGEKMTSSYSRDQAMLFFDRYNLRFNIATTALEFTPTPNASACKWCPHAKTQEDRDMPACGWRYGV